MYPLVGERRLTNSSSKENTSLYRNERKIHNSNSFPNHLNKLFCRGHESKTYGTYNFVFFSQELSIQASLIIGVPNPTATLYFEPFTACATTWVTLLVISFRMLPPIRCTLLQRACYIGMNASHVSVNTH